MQTDRRTETPYQYRASECWRALKLSSFLVLFYLTLSSSALYIFLSLFPCILFAYYTQLGFHNIGTNCFWPLWIKQASSSIFIRFYLRDAVNAVIATATCLAGWLGVRHTPVLYQTAKPIRKLFRPSESPITLVFWDPCADTKFQGEPLQRGR